MPDPFEAMAAGAEDHRRLLAAGRAPAQRREVVRHDLQRVQEIVEVLNLRDGPEAAQRGTDGLAGDRALADAGVHHPPGAVLFLQTQAALVDVAELADVFAE